MFNKIFNLSPGVKVEKVKRSADIITARQEFRMHEDLLTLENAIADADNLETHNRESLYRIMKRVAEDPHLASQWDTRKKKTIEKEFKVVSGKDETKENKEKTRLLETGWFLDFMGHVLDSIMYGFSLVEHGPMVGNSFQPFISGPRNNLFPAINLIDRAYVKPEFGVVVTDPGMIGTGVPFYKGELSNNTMFFGSFRDHGIMKGMIKYVLFKENCLGNWSEWSEVFGTDLIIGKTASEGEAKKDFLNQIKNMGSRGYGVLEPDDELEFNGTNRTDAWRVYDGLMRYIDECISKRIFGQDVVSNNTGRVVGEVGENISDLYGTSDAKFVARAINEVLFPAMTRAGVNMGGLIFKWDVTEKLKLSQRSEVDYKISQMGFEHEEGYINDTYGTKVKKKEPLQMEPGKEDNGDGEGKGSSKGSGKGDILEIAKKVANLYAAA